jgi:NAD(P)-dependent dehydrogenase (short-subunit alcohol dehydrogenase family)
MQQTEKTASANSKICVITGATSGIGRAVAFELAKRGVQLILISRNALKGISVAEKICRLHGEDAATFIRADLANSAEVRSAAHQIQNKHPRIDILVNNAGARFNKLQKNAGGIELTFATNHLGHFLLTILLLNNMKTSPAGRIINVASDAHCGYSADFDYVKGAGTYDRKAAYGRSKLANILFTYELARRLAGTSVTANALHPGGVATRLGKNNGMISWLKHIAYYALKGQLIFPARAAATLTHLALSDEVQGVTGKYFSGKNEIRSSAVSYEESAGRNLWEISRQMCGINETAP